MDTEALLTSIAKQSPKLASELTSLSSYIEHDPDVSVAKARKTLESVVSELKFSHGSNLAERISNLGGKLPDSILAYMHFIRKVGNSSIHGHENVSCIVASDVQRALIQIICWHLNIESNSTESTAVGARFFIADPIFNTWSKIAVLTPDGVLYSEYLTFMKPIQFKMGNFNFESFSASDFSFGEKEHGKAYQHLREVTKEEALEYKLNKQERWVQNYLDSIDL